MTLITVVCYDFDIFSRSKSHAFEKSTLPPCGYFSEIPARKKLFVFFLFRPFYVRLKLHDVKIIYPILREQTFFRRQIPDCREFLRKPYKSFDL